MTVRSVKFAPWRFNDDNSLTLKMSIYMAEWIVFNQRGCCPVTSADIARYARGADQRSFSKWKWPDNQTLTHTKTQHAQIETLIWLWSSCRVQISVMWLMSHRTCTCMVTSIRECNHLAPYAQTHWGAPNNREVTMNWNMTCLLEGTICTRLKDWRFELKLKNRWSWPNDNVL